MKKITFDSYQIESLKRAVAMIRNKVKESAHNNRDTQIILVSANEIEKVIKINEREMEQRSKMLIKKIE